MKDKLTPLMQTPLQHRERATQTHHVSRPHAAMRKAPLKAELRDNEGPRSNEDTQADGNLFREALFGSNPNDATGQPPTPGFTGGGQSGGQGGQQQEPERDDPRARQVAATAQAQRVSDAQQLAEAAQIEAGQGGWTELVIESRVAGKIRLAVLKEGSVLRARLSLGNPLATQWMLANLPNVESQLAADLGCAVRLEIR